MDFKVTYVEPIDDYKLLLSFGDRHFRVFDMKPYLDIGDYKELKDIDMFNTVKLFMSSVQWDNELDIDPEFLYDESIAVDVTHYAINLQKLNTCNH